MNPRNVIIVGCGYVGSALGRSLAAGGHCVVGTTTSACRVNDLRDLGMRAELVELSDIDGVSRLLADRDTVYLTIAPRVRGEDYGIVYVDGVNHLLSAAQGTNVRRIIYTSSTRVYGQNDGSWVNESSPTVPDDAKGQALLDAELALLNGSEKLGICATALRLCGIHGPSRNPADHIRNSCGTEREDGDQFVNMIHIDDVISALTRLLVVPYHGALNLADDHPDTRRAYFGRLADEAGLAAVRWVDPQHPNLGKRVSNRLIKKTLGLSLVHTSH